MSKTPINTRQAVLDPEFVLTPRHHRFLDLLFDPDCGTRAEAYRRVYPESSPDCASVNANKLLKNPKVRRAYRQRMARMRELSEMTDAEIIVLFEQWANAQIDDVVDFGPQGVKIRDSAELTPEAASVIDEVSDVFGSGGRRGVRVKLLDRKDAAKFLARIRGLVKEGLTVEQDDSDASPIIVVPARVAPGAPVPVDAAGRPSTTVEYAPDSEQGTGG